MDRKSQDKVLRAGFTIIRKDDQPTPRIKARLEGGKDYKTLQKFETKAARDRAFAELLKDETVISD